MFRVLILMIASTFLMTTAAQADTARWHDILQNAYPQWNILYEADIGDEKGIIAVITQDEQALTVIVDADSGGEARIHINAGLFCGALPVHDELWLGSGTRRTGDPLRPFLWYIPENGDGLYLVLARNIAGTWQVEHAEFGMDENLSVYTNEGVTATVRGDTLYPQVRTLRTLDLSFTAFDPVKVEAYTRSILNAPAEYQCYGLDCMENGPCQEHGIYLPDRQAIP